MVEHVAGRPLQQVLANGAASAGAFVAAVAQIHTTPLAAQVSPGSHGYTTGSGITIQRDDVGEWSVRFHGVPAGGAAVVSPYSSGFVVCSAGLVSSTNDIVVHCVGPDGFGVDTPFSVSYVN